MVSLGCWHSNSSAQESRTAGSAIRDVSITASVKIALVFEPGVAATEINVDTDRECIGVFPGVTKAAFVVGGEFGRGVFTCRQKNGTMGAPAFFTIGGGSFAWQFGGQQADLVLLIMNENGVKHLLQDKFTLGGEASAVAGPVGRTAQASTDAQMHAEILSWSRSRGVFLGASLEGVVIKPNQGATEEFYGKPVTANDILVAQIVPAPDAARSFVKTAIEFSKRSS